MLVNRPIVVCVMACALLASVVAAPAAIAGPLDQERYLESYGSPPATDDGAAAAQAQESYYSSYGSPQNTSSGGADWLPTALFSVALVLAAIAIIVVLRRRRFHTGRRTARIAVKADNRRRPLPPGAGSPPPAFVADAEAQRRDRAVRDRADGKRVEDGADADGGAERERGEHGRLDRRAHHPHRVAPRADAPVEPVARAVSKCRGAYPTRRRIGRRPGDVPVEPDHESSASTTRTLRRHEPTAPMR